MLIEVEHEFFGSIRELRTPMRVGDEIAHARRAPKRNEHGAEILAEIGYSPPEIEQLAVEGAFG
jgi:crotonobetainyl-CoA:carnitine CoA-transferase CaiB-like acyl-CoA transferase